MRSTGRTHPNYFVRAALRRHHPPEATKTALVGLGLEADNVNTEPFRPGPTSDTPPPGSAFAVKFDGTGCVIGSLSPDRLDIEVTGAAAEFGCLEPFTH